MYTGQITNKCFKSREVPGAGPTSFASFATIRWSGKWCKMSWNQWKWSV